MKRIFKNKPRHLTVAAVVVIATLGFTVGTASAATKHGPWHHHFYCPFSLTDDSAYRYCRPLPQPVPVPPTTIPTPTSTRPPVTVTLPRPPITVPKCQGPIVASVDDMKGPAMCPLSTATGAKPLTGATASAINSVTAIRSTDVEIGTACTITRSSSGTTSIGCND